MKTSKQLLLDAAKLLETHGWTQGAYARETADGERLNYFDLFRAEETPACFCTMGALHWASRGEGGRGALSTRTAIELNRYLEERGLLADGEGIPDWNDKPDRTREEVVETLRACADTLEEP